MKKVLTLCLIASGATAIAQGLPAPSRTVYKCEDAKQVYYSDSPCLGAKKLEVAPTRGLNKSSGQELKGRDVQRELQREQFAEAAKPLTGMNAQQLDLAGRRQRLSPEVQRQCRIWDQQVLANEATERAAESAQQRSAAQQRLFELRTAHRKAGCG
ncbi:MULTISPECIES: hypothetical protein [unclassified Roseateles]|uniref:hypothetical protein n=1 Tax=unclassified Roseateles TaxID=2626991 RepID=UPI0012E3ED22|nr:MULTISPECIES: hypothetical protein [unclassified Roseateles]